MKKIPTVLGKIDLDSLGNTLCHEHILISSPSMTRGFGERWVEPRRVIERAVMLFSQIKELGVDTVIDGTPLDLGRDIDVIREVSERSGINVIVSSGMFTTEEHFMTRWKPEKLAAFFIDECERGIVNTNVKPGMLKCATGSAGMTDSCKFKLDVMSIVQRETGLPLFAHNFHDKKTAYGQLELFERNGVNFDKLIIGHCSDSRDIEYLTDIAKSGCFIGFDKIFATEYPIQARILVELLERGYEDKILLSHDFFAYTDTMGIDFDEICMSDRTYTVVHKLLIPELRSLGVTEAQIYKLTTANPRTLFEKY